MESSNKKIKVIAFASIGGHAVQAKKILDGFRCLESDLYIAEKGSRVFRDFSRSDFWNALICAKQLVCIIRKENPSVIMSTGAAPGLLSIIVGKILFKKTIWIDSLANPKKLSLSGRLSILFADVTLTQWEHLENKKVRYWGGIL